MLLMAWKYMEEEKTINLWILNCGNEIETYIQKHMQKIFRWSLNKSTSHHRVSTFEDIFPKKDTRFPFLLVTSLSPDQKE